MNPSDFSCGEIYKMNVASRSHVCAPYYVEIIEIGKDFIVTNIPSQHSLKISKQDGNWDYRIPRMEYVSKKNTHGHLLLNQNIKHTHE